MVSGVGPALVLEGAQEVKVRERAVERHLQQSEIEAGRYSLGELLRLGEQLFTARWTRWDGQGRPAATGAALPTRRDPRNDRGLSAAAVSIIIHFSHEAL